MAQPILGLREIAVFRLRRHHFLDRKPASPVAICRDICGMQAQLMSAAYLQFWTRNHALTRAGIEEALWKERTLLKTSLMRQTVHLIPADEFPLYIAALRTCRVADALRIMGRCGIGREEGEALTPLIMDVLASGPLGRSDIAAAIRPKVSKRVRAWMEKVWSIVRIPIAEGLICYGSGEDNEVKFVRVDQWMPEQEPVSEREAQGILLRKYLRAYGPATLQDFSKWAGISMSQVKALGEKLPKDVVGIEAGTSRLLLLSDDRRVLQRELPTKNSIKLLPLFDPFLLAHAEKDHLIAPAHYKKVYRNQGWISAVVLMDGKIRGTWSYALSGKRITVSVEAFTKFPRIVRTRIDEEAASLARFFDKKLEVAFLD